MKAWALATLIHAAFFQIVAAEAISRQPPCRQAVPCPCGQSGDTVMVCVNESSSEDVCGRWGHCKSCQDGLEECLDCEPGFEGPRCSKISLHEKESRRIKRQSRRRTIARNAYGRNNPSRRAQEPRSCRNPGEILDGSFRVLSQDSSRSRLSNQEEEYPADTRLRYQCDRDQVLVGSSELVCRSNGSWSSIPPFCSRECGRSFVEGSRGKIHRRVLHGTTTEDGEWPWVVAVAVRRGNFSSIECGGALLDSRTVVTAAHCLVADSYTLYFGKTHRSNGKDDAEVVVRQSTGFVRHPDYDSTSLDSDIGLIFFGPRVRFSDRVQPVCLPSRESAARNLMTGKTGYVQGWGVTEKQLPAEELLMAQLPVLADQDCEESYRRAGSDLEITPRMFCAGFRDARQAVCSGDSGSPIVFEDRDGRFTLEGLVSFGVQGQCGQPERYTLFTKVLPFVPWILRRMARNN